MSAPFVARSFPRKLYWQIMKDLILVKDHTIVEFAMRISELITITVYMEEMFMDQQVQSISRNYRMRQINVKTSIYQSIILVPQH